MGAEYFNLRPKADGSRRRRGRCKECEVRANNDYRARNPEKVREFKRDWYRRNPDKNRRTHYRSHIRKWGHDPEPVLDYIDQHDPEVCDLCGGPPDGRWPSLHLDHDGSTGAIRGLLCSGCNLALGKFDHDIDRLLKAVAYLRQPPIFSVPG